MTKPLNDEALDMWQARAYTAQASFNALAVPPSHMLALIEEVRHLRQRVALVDALGLININAVADALGLPTPADALDLYASLRAYRNAGEDLHAHYYALWRAVRLMGQALDLADRIHWRSGMTMTWRKARVRALRRARAVVKEASR